jgi:predicted phosphoribosyltransferase
LEKEVNEVMALQVTDIFFSIGQFYEDFSQVSDEEVSSLEIPGR